MLEKTSFLEKFQFWKAPSRQPETKTDKPETSEVLREQLKVLEVGAGEGRLSHFLQEVINQKASGVIEVKATDDYSKIQPVYEVKQMDYREALNHQPDIVICSWMPPARDWSQAFRGTSSVREYLLIGEENKDCGAPATWPETGPPFLLSVKGRIV